MPNSFSTVTGVLLLALLLGLSPRPAGAESTTPDASQGPEPVDYDQWVEQAEEALAKDSNDLKAKLLLGQAQYFRSVFLKKKPSKNANKAALAALGEVLEAHPDDPIALAYHGSSELIQAKHAWAPWDKGKHAKSGLIKLQQAGDIDPDNPHVLALRGIATSYLPDMFEYQEKSKADLAAVAPHAEDYWRDGTLTANLAAAVLYHHGKWLEEDGNVTGAIEAYENTLAIAQDSEAGKDAQAALNRLNR